MIYEFLKYHCPRPKGRGNRVPLFNQASSLFNCHDLQVVVTKDFETTMGALALISQK